MYVWRGRLNRLGIIIANICFYGVMNILITPMFSAESWTIFWTAWVLLAVFLVLSFGVMCSRLHDIGKPGYWAVPWFVSGGVNDWFLTPWSMIVVLVIGIPCIFWPGEDGTNQWGAPGIGIVKYCKRILGMNYSLDPDPLWGDYENEVDDVVDTEYDSKVQAALKRKREQERVDDKEP